MSEFSFSMLTFCVIYAVLYNYLVASVKYLYVKFCLSQSNKQHIMVYFLF